MSWPLSRNGFRIAVVAVFTMTLTGCALDEDEIPRDLPPEEVADVQLVVTGDEATGLNRIYLLSQDDDRTLLRSVARDVPASARSLLESLIAGPNTEELDRSLSTAVPPELEILATRSFGFVLIVDVNEALATLSSEALTLALAQIVATVTELKDVERVRIRTYGENQSWPTSSGLLSADPLSIYDYPNLIETTQPALPTLPST